MEISEKGDYRLKSIGNKNAFYKNDDDIKITVNYLIPSKISVTFLTPTTFCNIGYTKWYFKTHFYSVFEVLEKLK